MSFSVSVIADIFKFPWPLFPKYKNNYILGLRYDIPSLVGPQEFIINLPPNNKYELQSFAYSSTGYKDSDNYSLLVNDIYVFTNIYTKELGQVKDIRPIKKILSVDTVKFIFNNATGTSKVIWIDLDLTCLTPIIHS